MSRNIFHLYLRIVRLIDFIIRFTQLLWKGGGGRGAGGRGGGGGGGGGGGRDLHRLDFNKNLRAYFRVTVTSVT